MRDILFKTNDAVFSYRGAGDLSYQCTGIAAKARGRRLAPYLPGGEIVTLLLNSGSESFQYGKNVV